MALAGTYSDVYKQMFSDTLLHELEQNGSHLKQTVMIEPVSGEISFFDKIGNFEVTKKTSRNQEITYSDANYERRQIITELNDVAHIMDVQDLSRYASNPQSDRVVKFVNALGQKADTFIYNAAGGNAVVTANGSTSNTSLPSASKVIVSNNDYDSGSGDTSLTTGKLKKALALLAGEYVDISRERIYCIGPVDQFMKLATETEVISSDFSPEKILHSPGIFQALSGYLNITFIQYEDVSVDGASDELLYVYPQSAIKLGVQKDLFVDIDRIERRGLPDRIYACEEIGATRVYEEKVIEIACDPIA